jgi:proline racemase
VTVVHPPNPAHGYLRHDFHGPATVAGADLRNVTIFAEAEVDRSPCGTGTCAVLAVLDAMGVVDEPIRSCTRASSARPSARASSSA